jgi:hypothetical protein
VHVVELTSAQALDGGRREVGMVWPLGGCGALIYSSGVRVAICATWF